MWGLTEITRTLPPEKGATALRPVFPTSTSAEITLILRECLFKIIIINGISYSFRMIIFMFNLLMPKSIVIEFHAP